MIYIYTISSDQSCNYIIDWLIKLKVHYKRVNSDFFYSFFNFNDDELENNDVHWFWKWEFPDFYSKEYFSSIYNNDIFNFALDTEYRSLFRLYFDNCKGKVINHLSCGICTPALYYYKDFQSASIPIKAKQIKI